MVKIVAEINERKRILMKGMSIRKNKSMGNVLSHSNFITNTSEFYIVKENTVRLQLDF